MSIVDVTFKYPFSVTVHRIPSTDLHLCTFIKNPGTQLARKLHPMSRLLLYKTVSMDPTASLLLGWALTVWIDLKNPRGFSQEDYPP
ncbi:hypothetical protein AVEN_145705-1 [Araneus ventricosus]|uniref:Uncharacterized protein n=1 Tax=Araneus ventricosus TaxID=182803 RepID=A0A4Y2RT16_ARAVE|nr:hypothetical protein AVEN_145705-1 [Araneus ventricosus]